MNNNEFIINQVDNTALNRFFAKIYGFEESCLDASANRCT